MVLSTFIPSPQQYDHMTAHNYVSGKTDKVVLAKASTDRMKKIEKKD